MGASRLEGAAIVRHVVIGVLERPFETLQLQRAQLILARGLDGLELGRRGFLHWHGVLRLSTGNTGWSRRRDQRRGAVDQRSADLMRAAAKQRDAIALRIAHLDVVDAGTA